LDPTTGKTLEKNPAHLKAASLLRLKFHPLQRDLVQGSHQPGKNL